jgi:cobalt-zinc-cadmium efflux system protein
MSHSHSHAVPSTSNERALWLAVALTGSFMITEVVGGLLSHSLALLSDAAHMLTDVTALLIALMAVRIGRRPFDSRRTFGYRRFEILAAAGNAGLLFLVAGYILYEACQRFRSPPEVQPSAMLAIAALGLGINLIAMRLLSPGRDRSLNVKGAYLEVWSDMLGSIGVIVGALMIRFTSWMWIDPLIAAAIGLWVLPRTWVLLKESLNLLLEGVPEGLVLADVEQMMKATPGVNGVHDLHVWAITTGQVSLTAHLEIDPTTDPQAVLRAVSARLEEAHHIKHTTLQCECGPCPNPADEFHGVRAEHDRHHTAAH